MSHKPQLLPPDPRRITRAFGLSHPEGPLRPLTDERRSGAVWALDTPDGRFVVKRVRWGNPPEWWFRRAELAMDLERRAVEAGLDVPDPIEPVVDGFGFIAFFDGAPYRVHVRLDGRPLTSVDDVAEWVGRTLAALHRLALEAEPDPQWYGIHDPRDWLDWIRQSERQGRPWYPAARRSLSDLEGTAEIAREALHLADDWGIVHRDVNPWNVLVTDDGPYLTDFDTAGPDSAWLEANSTALEFAFLERDEPDPRIARRILGAYVETGGRRGPHRGTLAIGRWAGNKLMWVSWNMWRSLGHRRTSVTEREDADRIVADELEDLPEFRGRLQQWGALLEVAADEAG